MRGRKDNMISDYVIVIEIIDGFWWVYEMMRDGCAGSDSRAIQNRG